VLQLTTRIVNALQTQSLRLRTASGCPVRHQVEHGTIVRSSEPPIQPVQKLHDRSQWRYTLVIDRCENRAPNQDLAAGYRACVRFG
jgi:hypothetical protein